MTPAQESALFHYELGLAITHWAHVEMDLRHLVTAALPSSARHLTSIGYFSIENFRSKLAYCDNILTEQFYKSPNFDRWPPMQKKVQSLSTKRNRLAHQTVMVFVKSKPGRRHALMNWVAEEFTAPSKASKSRTGFAPPTDGMCIREIVEARHEFEAVMHSLRNFRAALLGEPEPHATNLEVPKKVPTAAALWKAFRISLQDDDGSAK